MSRQCARTTKRKRAYEKFSNNRVKSITLIGALATLFF